MDVSQTGKSERTQFAWDIAYKSSHTEDFSSYIKEDRNADEPVREAKEKPRHDDRLEDEQDYDRSDEDRDPDPTAASDQQDVKTDPAYSSIAAAAPINTESADKSATSPAVVATVTGATEKTAAQTAATDVKGAPSGSAEKASVTPAAQQGLTTGTPDQTAEQMAAASQSEPTDKAKGPQKAAELGMAAQGNAATNALAGNAAAAAQKNSSKAKGVDTGTNPNAASAPGKQSDVPVKAAAADQSSPAKQAEIPAGPNKEQPNALGLLRADEMAKLSEKEVLSAKITEMLNSAKGKVSLTSTQPQTAAGSNSTSLLSNQTAFSATSAATQNTANGSTAIDTVTQAAQQAETPIHVQTPTTAPAPINQQASTDPSLTGNSSVQGAAIPGVEASSSSSNSQAANSARATMHGGSPAEQVSRQITAAVREGNDTLKIQLNPAELGRVDIKLEIAQDGRILAAIAADNQDSLDLLQQDSKALEKALQDAGFETSEDSLSFSLNQQQHQDRDFDTARNSDTDGTEPALEETETNPTPQQIANQLNDGGLDIAV
ncbi:flagellar hook-length control protein FliK [Sneathiella sp.]|jgi:flagellar hook-length control protein FliK|uniref:flagellar hook-length control protein FliK n=1 Tax=Sneathiella sp. TaxID=1964365 RepID=UPI0039E383EE